VPLFTGPERLLPLPVEQYVARSYAVWVAPGASGRVIGVHTGVNSWAQVRRLLKNEEYVLGRDRLRGVPNLHEATLGYLAEHRQHRSPQNFTVYVW
jgi:hypothetical protein